MRRSLFNVITVAAGAVLVAALGVSAHAQISSGFTRAGVHGQTITLHTEKGEVATEGRDNEPAEVPEQNNPEPTEAPEAPEAQDADSDNKDEQGDNDNTQTDDSGDTHDSGGD